MQLARSLAVEWASFCRVNCISPGYVATEMVDVLPEDWKTAWLGQIPMKRMCQPTELKGVSSMFRILVYCSTQTYHIVQLADSL